MLPTRREAMRRTAVAVAMLGEGAASTRQAAGRARYFYNDDLDRPFVFYSAPFQIQHLHDVVDVLLGTPVTTLVCNSGDDLPYYPSRVAPGIGWRKTALEETDPLYRRRYRVAQEIRAQGVDVLGVIRDRASAKGLEFVPSLRMNDGHFGQRYPPAENPATSKFWWDHQHLALGRSDPTMTGFGRFQFDFTHREVRQYRLAMIHELIDGYAEDGFEMDFTRHNTYFPRGRARPELITDLVREARRRLDQRGKRVGRRLPLMVRVLANLRSSRAATPEEQTLHFRCPLELSLRTGLDIREWIRAGYVDRLVVADPTRIMGMDRPLHKFLEAARGSGCAVFASPETRAHRADGKATLEMYRAAWTNYFALGQHGTYVFNFFTRHWPLTSEDYGLLRDLTSPETLRGQNKLYVANHESFLEPPYLPLALSGGERDGFLRILILEDLDPARRQQILKRIELRLRVEGLREQDLLDVTWNGQPLSFAAADWERVDFGWYQKQPGWSVDRSVVQGPFVWLVWDITGHETLRGVNQTGIRLSGPGMQVRISGLEVSIQYDADPFPVLRL